MRHVEALIVFLLGAVITLIAWNCLAVEKAPPKRAINPSAKKIQNEKKKVVKK